MTAPRTPTRSPPRLMSLILLTGTAVLSLNMFLPSLPGIARDLNADYALVNLALAGYLAATAAILLVVGPLSDRVGRRPVMLGALAVFTAASVVCAVAEDVWTFLAFRMLQSGVAAGSVLSMAIARDTHSQREAAGLIGYIGSAMAVAPMLGPMLGGVIDTAFGWRANFWFYAASGLALLALCWIDLGETRVRKAESAAGQARMLLGEARFWAYALCTVLSRGAFYVFIAGTPIVAATTFGVSTVEIGLYIGSITAGFMAGAFLSGRIAPHFAPMTMMTAGRLIGCAGPLAGLALLAYGGASGWASPVLFFGCTVLVGIGNGITCPSSSAAAMSVRPEAAGSAAGTEAALTVAGGALLTTVTGLVLANGDAPQRFLLLLLAPTAVALLAVFWAMRLESRRGASQES